VKLYHGTTRRVAEAALKEGLLPRELTKTSNWNHTVESRPDCVYLTTCYAPYFAVIAAEQAGKQDPAIIEIETDSIFEHMLPDEDFLEQATRNLHRTKADHRFRGGMRRLADTHKQCLENTRWFRENLPMFSDLWQHSADGLGTCCCCGAIPTSAITRAITWDRDRVDIWSVAVDAQISLLNKQFCSNKYIALTAWLFDNPIKPSEFVLFGESHFPGMLAEYQQMISNREGIAFLATQPAV
jgi:hypothetical protein